MVGKRSSKLWMVNVISFVLLIILTVTGLLNWLVLPRGYEARGSYLVFLRHSLVAIHECAALIFMIAIGVHIALHWSYIESNLKRNSGRK